MAFAHLLMAPADHVIALKTIVSADGQRRLMIYKDGYGDLYGACEDMAVHDFYGHKCWSPAWFSELDRMTFTEAASAEAEAVSRVGWTVTHD